MKLQNNYILLQRERTKNKPTNEINKKGETVIRLDCSSLEYCLNNIFNIKPIEWEEKLKFFCYVVSFQYSIGSLKVDVSFEIFRVQSHRYLNIEVNAKTKLQCVKGLEIIDSKLSDSDSRIEKQFIIISAYDAVSEFYCNKIFSKFAHFERQFRRLLFNIYVLNYDKEYYEKTIQEEITNKAKGNIRARKNKEEHYLKKFFYYLDYGDLQSILFTPKWTSADEEAKDTFLSNHDNLSSLSDRELRQFIQNIGKSDWERLFKDKIGLASIEKDINFIRMQRNKVAHSKFFTYNDYKESLKTLNELQKALNKAIVLTQNKDFVIKNFEGMQKGLQQFGKRLTELIIPILPIMADNMIKSFETLNNTLILLNNEDESISEINDR